MKFNFLKTIAVALTLALSPAAMAQLNWGKALSAGAKLLESFTLTDEQMAEYVKESVKKMDSENKVLPANNAYSQRLAKITAGVTQADGIPLNFKVYQTTDINAFACPDGSVRVYTGIMDLLNDDELMGVIGHEIGHVMLHHSRKALQKQLNTSAVIDAASSASSRIAALSESQLGAIGETLLNAKYSRKQETEADEAGYNFLVKNGRNPWGMVSAFEKMQSLEGSGTMSGTIAKMFSSHPDTAARIKAMTKRCKKDGYQRP